MRWETCMRFCLFGVAVSACMAAGATPARDLVDVTLPQQVAPHMVRTIAELGEPEQIVIKSGDSLLKLVNEKCGSIDPIYFTMLAQANKELGSTRVPFTPDTALPVGQQLVLPACAPPPAPAARRVESGDRISRILPPEVAPTTTVPFDVAVAARKDTITMALNSFKFDEASVQLPASAFSQSQNAARAANSQILAGLNVIREGTDFVCTRAFDGEVCLPKTVAAPPTVPPPRPHTGSQTQAIGRPSWALPVDPNFIREGEMLLIPSQQPIRRSIVLRDGVSAEAAAGQINAAARLDRLPVTDAPPPAAPGVVATPPLPASGANAACRIEPVVGRWPLPLDDLKAQWQRTEQFREKVGPQLVPGSIMVLDSGFDFKDSDPGYPAFYFPNMRSLDAANSAGLRISPQWHREGLNFAEVTNSSATSRSYVVSGRDMRWHGAAVISAALGSRGYDKDRGTIFARVLPASAVDYRSNVPTMSGDALRKAIKFAGENRINVLNFSAAAPKDLDLEAQIALYAKSVVIVAAAGNDGSNAIKYWPARLGGDPANLKSDGAVIVVGGHEPDYRLWPASNINDKYVDILAPACGIPLYEGPQSPQGTPPRPVPTVLAGTSFAAPIVSAVAGLLSRQGLNAKDIKARINFSARIVPEAWATTYSGGALDAENALSIYEDALRFTDGAGKEQRLTGDLTNRNDVWKICGRTVLADNVRKYATVDFEGTRRVRAWWREAEDAPDAVRDCLASDSKFDLNFTAQTGGSGTVTVKSDELIDYVRRF